MGSGYQYIDILLFAAIAGFLVLRLRNVLGRRTGTERRRDPFAPPRPPLSPQAAPSAAPGAKVIEATAVAVPPSGPGGIAALKAADPSFAVDTFLQGARGAFEIIVNAFAAGETDALKPLLSPDVFAGFAEAIRARAAAHETLQNTLISIKSVEITDAHIEGDTALVTVKFVSEQSTVTRDAAGKAIDGDPERVVEHCDFWTFARAVRARNPNWMLVATHSP
jgi:predicted lipid-binding transport protein (Tim44 family)